MEACIPLGGAADDELAGGRSPPPPQASTSEVSSVAAGDLPCDEDREAAPEDGAGAAVDEAPGEGDDGGRCAPPMLPGALPPVAAPPPCRQPSRRA